MRTNRIKRYIIISIATRIIISIVNRNIYTGIYATVNTAAASIAFNTGVYVVIIRRDIITTIWITDLICRRAAISIWAGINLHSYLRLAAVETFVQLKIKSE